MRVQAARREVEELCAAAAAAEAAHEAELQRLQKEDEEQMRAAGAGVGGDGASTDGSGSDDVAVVVGDIEIVGGKDVEAAVPVVDSEAADGKAKGWFGKLRG